MAEKTPNGNPITHPSTLFYAFFLPPIPGLLALTLLSACSKNDTSSAPATLGETDATLFAEASKSGFAWYAGTPGITPTRSSSNGTHGFERVRFNAVAQGALDATGKLPVGGTFPVGSVIVKEEYATATGPLVRYAVLKKTANGPAAARGYAWGKYALDGRPVMSVADPAATSTCVSCHTGSLNRDLIRSFDAQ